jgi:hypothetical protein
MSTDAKRNHLYFSYFTYKKKVNEHQFYIKNYNLRAKVCIWRIHKKKIVFVFWIKTEQNG